MISSTKRTELEDEYEMPVERMLFHLYHERGLSSGEIADELDEPRSTVKDWLRQSGIQLRNRQLSDIQRILIMAYIDAGLGNGSISARVGCGVMTVRRFRKQLDEGDGPAELDGWVGAEDYALLSEIVDDSFGTD